LPVVVTENGGPSESLREDDIEYGVLVDPSDPEDIARGLRRVLDEGAAWETFARRGRERVLERYTWERTARAYIRVIEQLVAEPEARRTQDLLPIHPYFRDPTPKNDISLGELEELYFASE
jgi:sucrose-phosphate synthase